MTYHCGIQGMGSLDREPYLACDGCGLKRTVQKPSGMPYAWFLDRKKAPGWSADLRGTMRRDWCGECTAKRKALPAGVATADALFGALGFKRVEREQ